MRPHQHPIIFRLLLVFVTTVFSCPLLHSQNPIENHALTHQFKFSVYPIGKADWKEIYYQKQPGIYESLTFWSYERSPKNDYKGIDPIEFFRKTTGPEGEIQYRVVASTQFETNATELLFFFIASGTKEAGQPEFQLVPMEEDDRTFPLDTVTFVNVTGANLEGVFGNKPIFLKKGVSAPYDLKPFYKQETLIGLAVQFEGDMKKVLHSKWSFYPDYREIILLLPPKSPGSFKIQAFRITQHKEEIHPSTMIQ